MEPDQAVPAKFSFAAETAIGKAAGSLVAEVTESYRHCRSRLSNVGSHVHLVLPSVRFYFYVCEGFAYMYGFDLHCALCLQHQEEGAKSAELLWMLVIIFVDAETQSGVLC